jgi:hypothetical protein
MKQVPARFHGLITDTCNVKAVCRMPYKTEIPTLSYQYAGPTPLEQLMLYHAGDVDLNSASVGEYAWYTPSIGGWFSFNCIDEAPRHGVWNMFIPALSQSSSEFFRDARSRLLGRSDIPPHIRGALQAQKAMTPQVFRMTAVRDLQAEKREPFEVGVSRRRLVPVP